MWTFWYSLKVHNLYIMLQEDLYEEFRRLKLIMKLRREMQNIVDPAHAALKVVY